MECVKAFRSNLLGRKIQTGKLRVVADWEGKSTRGRRFVDGRKRMINKEKDQSWIKIKRI